MFHKITVFFGLMLTATCTVYHQPAGPLLLNLQYDDNPNYNFAYEVNDAHTGDVKSQHESRRGDIVLGQYSLLQPDGVRRTVDYRADDHTGFQATVNNEGRPVNQHAQPVNNADAWTPNVPAQTHQTWPTASQPWPTPSSSHPLPAPTPVATSRSSFTQTFSHGPTVPSHNPWI